MVWINSYKRVNPGSPFGGVRCSGYGREMGFEAMHDYTDGEIGLGQCRRQPTAVLSSGNAWPMIVLFAEAVRELIHDGDIVAMEGFTHLIPMAAGHEVIRQERRDLTVSA